MQINIKPYEEHIVITGASSSGKTHFAQMLFNAIKNANCWIYDYNHQFTGAPIVNNGTSLNPKSRQIFRPKDLSEKTFNAFCNKAFNSYNLFLIFDELHQYISKQKINHNFNQIIMSGRPRGVTGCYISTRPATIPNTILTNVSHLVAFGLHLPSDIKFLEEYAGEEIWQLLPKDKRKKLKDLPELPNYSFLYRKQKDSKPIIHFP